jgi:hypothetical protein
MKKQSIDNEEFLSEKMLLQYKQGILSNAEMRKVERLLEKYPLYADALDGFALLDTTKIDKNIAFIKENLPPHLTAKQKSVLMHARPKNLMRIAAAITILFISSFGIYFIVSNLKGITQTAMVDEASPVLQENKSVESPVESEPYAMTEAQAKEEIAESKSIVQQEKKQKKVKETQEVTQNQHISRLEKDDITQNQKKSNDDRAVDTFADKPQKTTSKKDTLQRLAESAYSQVMEADDATMKKADVAKVEGTATNTPSLPSNKGMERKKQTQTEALKVADKEVVSKDTSFSNLLKKRLIAFAKERNEILKGKLIVGFTLTKKGIAKNIVVKESPCQSCENEAVKLIKANKNWEKNEQFLEISF